MPSFTHRSYEKELLDRNDIPFFEIKQNMQELNVINHLLGGHRCTLLGMKNMLDPDPAKKNDIHIAEIGCGGGDNLRVIREWGIKNKKCFFINSKDLQTKIGY